MLDVAETVREIIVEKPVRFRSIGFVMTVATAKTSNRQIEPTHPR